MACPTGKLHIESKDPRINYNLLEGETLLTCPYNLSHAVRPLRFGKHVMNCHRLHVKEQSAKGEQSLFSMCQYDRSHHVRNEELAFHESNCKAKDDDGWSDDDGAEKFVPTFEMAPLQKPPPIDEETLKVLQDTEVWTADGTGPKFDADLAVHNARMSGYKVIQAHKLVGLTKSEKKEFYEKERLALQTYDKIAFVDRLKQENIATGAVKKKSTYTSKTATSLPSGSQTCASAFGYEEPIKEEKEEDLK